MKSERIDIEVVQTKLIIYLVAVFIVLDMISLFHSIGLQKGFKKVLGLKYSYEYVELYQKYTRDDVPSLERSFSSNHDLPGHQTNQESPQFISGVQTQHSSSSGIPSLLHLRALAAWLPRQKPPRVEEAELKLLLRCF